MFESKVISQRRIDHLDSHGDKLPALMADIGFVTASPDLVVICQVYIENEFFG